MKIYNSLSSHLEEFKPRSKNKVTIYICGITPYDTTHLGHAFTYISFDILVRYLRFKGYNVVYTQNVTDINDRDKDILQRALEQNIPWKKLAQFWTAKFLKDMQSLNWTPPDNYLKASEQIASMIRIIKALVKNKLAYQKNGSVYLDISKIPDFGKLSRRKRTGMIELAKEFEEDTNNPDKRDLLDITLWKASSPNQPPHIPTFDSPFGKGRPGWHIECSAMSISSLGEQIDIHGGGKDLIFPHHEAEIAQSEGATGKVPFAKYWLHTGVVSYQGARMSKSKGNLVMVSALLKKYSANAIRWLLLSNHWSKNWKYFEKDLKKAQKKIDFIETSCVNSFESEQEVSPLRVDDLEGYKLNVENEIMGKFIKIMDNNLDTPKALEFLLELVKTNPKQSKLLYQILGLKSD